MWRKICLFSCALVLFRYAHVAANGKCGTALLDLDDLAFVRGQLSGSVRSETPTLDTGTVLLYSIVDKPAMPTWFPESWVRDEGITVVPVKIRMEIHRYRIIAVEPQTFLLVQWKKPLTVCDFLKGWEEWQQYGKDHPDGALKDALLVFERNGRREVLRNALDVMLPPGTNTGNFIAEVLRPIGEGSGAQLTGTPFVNHALGTWGVFVEMSGAVFPLRIARFLSGKYEHVASVEPLFVPLLSSIETTSAIRRIRSDGRVTNFYDRETISIEQAAYDSILEFSVLVRIFRDDAGMRYYNLLSRAQELPNLIQTALGARVNADTMRFDPGTCFESHDGAPGDTHVTIELTCRFVPMEVGQYEIQPLPLRFELARGGAPFIIPTERNFFLSVVALRHPEQDGIISHVARLHVPVDKEMQTGSVAAAADTEPIDAFHRSVGSRVFSFFGGMAAYAETVLRDPLVFVKTNRSVLLAFCALTLGTLLFVRACVWGFGVMPPLSALVSRIVVGVRLLASHCGIALLFARRPDAALQRALQKVRVGEDIGNLSIEVLAMQDGVHLANDPSEFFDWVLNVHAQRERELAPLERLFAAAWLERNASRWSAEMDCTAQRAVCEGYLYTPFVLRSLPRLPDFLRRAREEHLRAGK